jgi:hypothetical protein
LLQVAPWAVTIKNLILDGSYTPGLIGIRYRAGYSHGVNGGKANLFENIGLHAMDTAVHVGGPLLPDLVGSSFRQLTIWDVRVGFRFFGANVAEMWLSDTKFNNYTEAGVQLVGYGIREARMMAARGTKPPSGSASVLADADGHEIFYEQVPKYARGQRFLPCPPSGTGPYCSAGAEKRRMAGGGGPSVVVENMVASSEKGFLFDSNGPAVRVEHVRLEGCSGILRNSGLWGSDNAKAPQADGRFLTSLTDVSNSYSEKLTPLNRTAIVFAPPSSLFLHGCSIGADIRVGNDTTVFDIGTRLALPDGTRSGVFKQMHGTSGARLLGMTAVAGGIEPDGHGPPPPPLPPPLPPTPTPTPPVPPPAPTPPGPPGFCIGCNMPGDDYRVLSNTSSSGLSNMTADACAAACAHDFPRCKAWTWSTPATDGKGCYLKDAVAAAMDCSRPKAVVSGCSSRLPPPVPVGCTCVHDAASLSPSSIHNRVQTLEAMVKRLVAQLDSHPKAVAMLKHDDVTTLAVPARCPCADLSLRRPVQTPRPVREVLVPIDMNSPAYGHGELAGTYMGNWRTQIDWDAVTMLVLATDSQYGLRTGQPGNDWEVYCHAHSKGVRVLPTVAGGGDPAKVMNVTDPASRASWVAHTTATMVALGLDGVMSAFLLKNFLLETSSVFPQVKTDEEDAVPAAQLLHKLLFVDDSLFFNSSGQLSLRLQIPQKAGVVLEPELPWESASGYYYNTVIRMNSTHVFLYYDCGPLGTSDLGLRFACLAISLDDGRTFHKPELGIAAFNSSTANNIVWPLSDQRWTMHSHGVVFKDERPGCPVTEKIKMLAFWGGLKGDNSTPPGLWVLGSSDGINFNVLRSSTGPAVPQKYMKAKGFGSANLVVSPQPYRSCSSVSVSCDS